MLTKENLTEAVKYSERMARIRELDMPEFACACMLSRDGEFCSCKHRMIQDRVNDITDFLCDRPDPRGLREYEEKMLESIPLGLDKSQYYYHLRNHYNMSSLEAWKRTNLEFKDDNDF